PSLELHWALAMRHPLGALTLDALREGAGTVELEGLRARTFAPEDLTLALCLHGARHMWERLAWLCDLRELLRCARLDWDRLLARASRCGGRRVLLLGLHLAGRQLDAPLPETVRALAAADPAVPRLAEEALAQMFSHDGRAANSLGIRFHRFQVRAMD